MKADGLKADAIELKTATVHWLRHTGISEDVITIFYETLHQQWVTKISAKTA